MLDIKVGRYRHESITKDWQGWIEPADRSWIMFVAADGTPKVYLNRDPVTGAVLD